MIHWHDDDNFEYAHMIIHMMNPILLLILNAGQVTSFNSLMIRWYVGYWVFHDFVSSTFWATLSPFFNQFWLWFLVCHKESVCNFEEDFVFMLSNFNLKQW